MTCCEATSSAVFDGFALVCGAHPAQPTPARIASSKKKRAAHRLSAAVCVRCLQTSCIAFRPLKIFFSSFQCRTCAVDLLRQRSSTCRSVAHPISSNCSAQSRLCGFPGRLATKVDRPVVQCTCSHRRSTCAKLFQCLHASVQICRCKLAVALPSDTCPVQLSGGACTVPKDEDRDRLVCDHSPQNSPRIFSDSCSSPIPFSPRLRRLILERSQALRVHIIDTRNCFNLCQVDSSRWYTQIIGPRILASWLHHHNDDSSGDVNTDDLETWWEPHLCGSACHDEPHDGNRQIELSG